MKLVRDRIGDIPWPATYHGEPCGDQAKQHLGWVEPHSPKYRDLLRAKLTEEIAELLAVDGAGQPGAVLDETADVFEVLRALLVANGVDSPARVAGAMQRAAAVKLAARGGFFQGRTYDGPVRADHPARPHVIVRVEGVEVARGPLHPWPVRADHPAAASPCANGVYVHGPHQWLEPVPHECPGWPPAPEAAP